MSRIIRSATVERAQQVASQIRASLADALDLLKLAYDQQHWRVLGYADWPAYVTGEFGDVLPQLTGESLDELVSELAGWSTRAIAPVARVSQSTVSRAQRAARASTESSDSPGGRERVTGLDGRTQPATKPTAPGPLSAEPESASWPPAILTDAEIVVTRTEADMTVEIASDAMEGMSGDDRASYLVEYIATLCLCMITVA